MNMIDFIQDELKKARIEALKSTSYEEICNLLDDQETQLKAKDEEISVIKQKLKLSRNTASSAISEIGVHHKTIVDLRKSNKTFKAHWKAGIETIQEKDKEIEKYREAICIFVREEWGEMDLGEDEPDKKAIDNIF